MLMRTEEGGLAKCLCSKLVDGGKGVKNPQNSVNVDYGCPHIQNLIKILVGRIRAIIILGPFFIKINKN